MTDQCGFIKPNDEPCELPDCRDDGRCWHHTQTGDEDSGRPSKFTNDRKDAILDAARNGTTVDGCARAAGISHTTLYDWLDKFPDFSEAFNRARAEGEQRLVQDVAADDPRFLLERSYQYVKTERREIESEHEHSGSLDVEVSSAEKAQLADVLDVEPDT